MKLFIRINYEHSSYEDFFEVSEFPLVFGRDPRCQLRIMGKEIAREHGKIFIQNDSLFLSTDDQKVFIPIEEGTRFNLGRAILTFSFLNFPIDIDHFEASAPRSTALQDSSLGFDKWINLRVISILYFFFVLGVIVLSPNHFRSNDASKELLKFVMAKAFLFPIFGFLGIALFRKFNRGQYSWKRAVFFSVLFSLITLWIPFIEKLFCWFDGFYVVWNLILANFALPVLSLFLWFNAVGKEASQKSRLIRSVWIVGIFLALAYSAQVLSTGYSSDFQIETCSSLTGWHWGSGESLSQWQAWVEKAKFD